MDPYLNLKLEGDDEGYFTFEYTRPPYQHLPAHSSHPIVLPPESSPFSGTTGTQQSPFYTPSVWSPSITSDYDGSGATSGYLTPAEPAQAPSDETSDMLRDLFGDDNATTLSANGNRLLLQNCPDPLLVLTLGGTIVFASPSCQQTLGYQKEEFEGVHLSNFSHPSDVSMMARELKSAASSGSPFDVMLRMRRKSQGHVWVEMSGSVENGRQRGGGGSVAATARRRRSYLVLTGRVWSWPFLDPFMAEGGANVSERSLWMKLSAHGLILHAPAKCQQLLGRPQKTLACNSFLDVVPHEFHHRVRQVIDAASQGKTATCAHHIHVVGSSDAVVQTTMAPADAMNPARPLFLFSYSRFLTRKATALSLGVQIASPPSSSPAPSSSPFAPPSSTATFPQQTHPEVNLFSDLDPNSDRLWLHTVHEARLENERLSAELRELSEARRRRKRAMARGNLTGTCVNCKTRHTTEWRRGPSGNMDLCNSCGLRWAKSVGGVSLYHKRPKPPPEPPAEPAD